MLRFPAKVALIQDDELGWMLFDTGYSDSFFEVCKHWPDKLYKITTPVELDENAKLITQLRDRGISAEDISYVFLSHFHADHIAGVSHFTEAKFLYTDKAYDQLRSLSKWKQVKQGFLKGLLPCGFEQRSIFLESNALEKPSATVLDSDCYHWIDLPGHAPGHSGLLIKKGDQEVLLAADAFWLASELSQELRLTPISKSIISDPDSYPKTQQSIIAWLSGNPNRTVICCHDPDVLPEKIIFP